MSESLKNFFWFCSGANVSMLKRTPTDHQKYIGIGATVFFTGIFASIAAGYALYYVFNDLSDVKRISAAIAFGLLWGIMIFNLDRYIVSSMKKSGTFSGELKIALPRFILAGVIAMVISKPLELQIFHTSIEYKLREMEQAELKKIEDLKSLRYKAPIETIIKDIAQLQSQIDSQQVYSNTLAAEARKEADGTGGSGKRGVATIYKIKKDDATKAELELQRITALNQPQILAKQTELNQLRTELDSVQKAVNAGAYDGFDKRLSALGAVALENNTIATASWFVMLLFLIIEISPVLVKLLSQRGPYDDLLEAHEKVFENQRKEKIAALDTRTNIKLKSLAIQQDLEVKKIREEMEEKYNLKNKDISIYGI